MPRREEKSVILLDIRERHNSSKDFIMATLVIEREEDGGVS